ncbi:hypothetical protein K470DRAFT_47104 [Piedraia hortae CBS 480.64]|uniref:Uncharacterized protein n=1 Tax=Piedraia hortae CBS 480.64 TaxID=1314780 RepID=A0A6A7C2G9_9PEZI|nr:hypothetical protein K470DRAFT_47104 [Piedraia hortae CBS 480.64]
MKYQEAEDEDNCSYNESDWDSEDDGTIIRDASDISESAHEDKDGEFPTINEMSDVQTSVPIN